MPYVEMNVDQCKALKDLLQSKINDLQQNDILQQILINVNHSLANVDLFQVAVEWFNRNVREDHSENDYLVKCMSCNDCVIYRRYVKINQIKEPTTIYVVTGNKKVVTIISNEQSLVEIKSFDQLVEYMNQNRLRTI